MGSGAARVNGGGGATAIVPSPPPTSIIRIESISKHSAAPAMLSTLGATGRKDGVNGQHKPPSRRTSQSSAAESASVSSISEDAPPSRRLLLQTDILLMPLLTIAFGLQYYDKAILGSATLWGILTDLNVSGPNYKLASAAFYYGYLVGAFPMSVLVQRFKRRLNFFLGGMIMLWGAITMLTCVVSDWRGLVAQRIFLGIVESAVSPGFVAVTRIWYTKTEQPLRLGIWYSATGLFSIFSGLVNHALGEANTSLAPWKLMFLVPGTITIVFGALLLLLLPPAPVHSPVLKVPYYNSFNPSDRAVLDGKVRRNLTGNERAGASWSWPQAREAAMDVHIWIYFLMATAIYVVNGGVTVFGPILVKSIGYTSLRATILLTPGGAATAVSIYIFCLVATLRVVTRTSGARTALLIVSCWPVIIGAAMCWRGDWTNKAVPLAGYYLLPTFGTPFVLMLGSSTANMAGSTKQAIASGAIFVGYNCGNIAASYTLITTESAIHYPTTFRIIIGVMCATMVLAALQALLYARENRRRNHLRATQPVSDLVTADKADKGPTAVDDMAGQKEPGHKSGQKSESIQDQVERTDRENKKFRYTY